MDILGGGSIILPTTDGHLRTGIRFLGGGVNSVLFMSSSGMTSMQLVFELRMKV